MRFYIKVNKVFFVKGHSSIIIFSNAAMDDMVAQCTMQNIISLQRNCTELKENIAWLHTKPILRLSTKHLSTTFHTYYLFQSDLFKHMRSHSNDKPFACEYCDKSFKTKSFKIVHLRSHTGMFRMSYHFLKHRRDWEFIPLHLFLIRIRDILVTAMSFKINVSTA